MPAENKETQENFPFQGDRQQRKSPVQFNTLKALNCTGHVSA